MKAWRKYALLAIVLFVAIWLYRWLGKPDKLMEQHAKQIPSSAVTAMSPHQIPTSAPNLPILQEYPQISLKGRTRDEAIRDYLRYQEKDNMYDWKIPIRFYGKVIDQHDQPVTGATVRLQWINRQGIEGVGESHTITDGKGQFSLEGVKGKRLLVWISREGYYDVSRKDNQTSFEFASPAQNDFYEPNSDNPVIFHMRKEGELPPLVVKKVKFNITGQGNSSTLDFLTGNVSSIGGQLNVTTWKVTITREQINMHTVFPYDWKAILQITNGGLLEHKDVYPFEAPESGYVPNFELNEHVINGAMGGTLDKQFYFFFGQPRLYGRMHIRTNADSPEVVVDYVLNPQPGSRNLEYDPSKQAPVQ